MSFAPSVRSRNADVCDAKNDFMPSGVDNVKKPFTRQAGKYRSNSFDLAVKWKPGSVAPGIGKAPGAIGRTARTALQFSPHPDSPVVLTIRTTVLYLRNTSKSEENIIRASYCRAPAIVNASTLLLAACKRVCEEIDGGMHGSAEYAVLASASCVSVCLKRTDSADRNGSRSRTNKLMSRKFAEGHTGAESAEHIARGNHGGVSRARPDLH